MLCFHMCSSMRNVSHLGWTSSRWMIRLKSSPVNSMRMSNRFGVPVLHPCQYTLQLCNWTVGEARLFWKGEHFTYCVACAVALKRTHGTLLHFSASSSGFPCARHALRLAFCSKTCVIFCCLNCLVVQSLSPLLHCRAESFCFFWGIFMFDELLFQNPAHVTRA